MSIGETPLASYSYDAVGRVAGINNVAFGYLANGNLLSTVTRPNNVNTTWSYEANRNLVTAVENKLENTVISNYGYTNDLLGRRTEMIRSGTVFAAGDTLSYSYNDRSEVTGANSNAAGTTYNYAYSFDNIGNRLTANLAGTPWTYTANNLNEYSAFTINQVAETPSYDDDGNMLTRDGWTQTWNGENRLIKAEKGTAKLEFAYDYMGRRIFKKVYNGETLTSHIRFVYNGYKLIEELNALNNNAVLRRYTWSLVGLDTPVSVYDASANATYYYNTDANKNITELTDATGAVVAHYEYSPFGKVLVANGTYASINPFRFSSEYHDDETALVYYNYRYYSPELGRWMSRDPIGEKGGENLYAGSEKYRINNKSADLRTFRKVPRSAHTFSVCIFLSSYFTTIWQLLIVSKAASCFSLVTPAAHAESTKTGVSGRNALIRSAFETTQISVQSPTSSMDSIGVFLFLSRRSSASSGHPKVIFS